MCLTFFKKFARNNTARPCVLAQFFKNVKHYLLNYGRIFAFKFQRLSSRFLRVCVVRCFYVVLLCWLSSFPLLADWTSENTQTLNLIHGLLSTVESNSNSNESNIGDIREAIYNSEWGLRQLYRRVADSSGDLTSIKQELATFADENNYNLYLIYKMLGYSVSSSSTECLAWDLDDIKENLTSIITALETTNDSLNALNSGLGYTYENTLKDDMQRLINAVNDDISGDFVKEDTFQTYYNWMRSALGYEGGSSGSLRDLLEACFLTPAINGTYSSVVMSEEGWDNVPFPVESHGWVNYFQGSFQFGSSGNWLQVLSTIISNNLEGFGDGLTYNFQKSSWNDWYAHTNLVATIVTQADRFFTQPASDPSPTPSFNPSTGQMVTPSTGTGSADETITVSPSFTNDFAQIEQDTNTVTNNFAFVKEQEIKNRYFVEGILEVGEYRDYATLGSGFADVINIAGMTIDLNSQFANYRKIISSETLQTVRTVVGYLWHFFAIVASFFVVVKISGMSLGGGGDE